MNIFSAKTYGFFLSLFLAVLAQGQDASAVIDRDKIRIGEQAIIKLSVRFDKANPHAVTFPPISDTLVKGVEVVRFTPVDTLETGAGVKESRLEQQLFITSFDSGFYAIPPFIIDIDGIPTKTEAFLLSVETVEIDTTKGIVDVREIYEVEVGWMDFLEVYWPYVAGALGLVAILVTAIVLFLRYRKKRRLRPAVLPPEPEKSPQAIALETLRQIQEEKAYKTGDVKDYHTSITDTLRTYLENAFGVHAHELTTRQILDKLRYSGIPEPQLRALRTILFRADMVKFAKEKPDYTDNEEAVAQAIDFVKATMAMSASETNLPPASFRQRSNNPKFMSRQQKIALFFALLSSGIALGVWLYFRDAYEYYNESFFYLLILVPLAGIYHVWRIQARHPKVKLSALNQFPAGGQIFTEIQVHLPFLMRMVAVSFLIVAICRPQSQLSWQNVTTEGIDIVIAMDISASMLAQDFQPNRLERAKEVAISFIQGRPNDRIGLVVYEGESFTQCPLTSDHRVLISLFKDVKTGVVQGGTAIGMGLATAVNRLRESEARSKVVILMTDGDNNAGSIAPITAAEIAQSFGIRVYTIGVGTIGRAKSPVAMYPDGTYKYEMADVKIDEETMKSIAGMTDAEYFRATDGNALSRIFSEIDRLEKTKISVTEHRQKSEQYYWFLVVGSVLLLAEFLFRQLFLQTLP